MHVIAAKAVAFKLAAKKEFKIYQSRIVDNARALSEGLSKKGYRIVSGGTDNHLLLVDVSERGLSGKDAAAALDRADITVNKNLIPFDKKSPMVTSGIRLGTPSVTTRGMRVKEMYRIAELIDRVLSDIKNEKTISGVRKEVNKLTGKFPLYKNIIKRAKRQ
jgi:glycine hydroxymethyltransferase